MKPFIVCSFGGCGSKLLVKELANYIGSKNYGTYHSHIRSPDDKFSSNNQKIIYLHCNPAQAVFSFFERRKMLTEQHGFVPTVRAGSKDWVMKHCSNVGGKVDCFDTNWDLDEYLDNGEDLLLLDGFVSSWLKFSDNREVLFLRYEALWENLPNLARFVNYDLNFCEEFASQKVRVSYKDVLTGKQQKKLESMYASTKQSLDTLDDFFISNTN
jgi:hypothetical protein